MRQVLKSSPFAEEATKGSYSKYMAELGFRTLKSMLSVITMLTEPDSLQLSEDTEMSKAPAQSADDEAWEQTQYKQPPYAQ